LGDVILWPILLLPLVVTLVLASLHSRRLKLQLERRSLGLATLFRLQKLLMLLLEHRGLSYRILSSDETVIAKLLDLEDKIFRAEESVHLILSWEPDRENWWETAGHWRRLQSRNLDLSRKNNFEQHNRLIASIISLMRDITEHSELYASELSDCEAKWKLLLEFADLLGQARALGSAALGRGYCEPLDAERMIALQQRILQFRDKLEIDLPSLDQMLASLVAIVDQVSAELSVDEFFALASDAIQCVAQAYEQEMEDIALRIGKITFSQVGPKTANRGEKPPSGSGS